MSSDQDDETPPIAPRLQPGDHVGERYQIVRFLGQGGIGAVYEAVNTWTGRHVAVKLLQSRASSSEGILRRFKLEAQTAAQLRHPNIVEVLDMGPDPRTGALFIVQELLKGADVRERLTRSERLSVAETFDLMVPVMGALAAAHAKGFLHRDVKPENIFLVTNDDGTVTPKLIDFGLAKVLGEEAAKQGPTGSGVMLGTPAYMSPEQFQGASDIDARADVWAVGAVLYELLCGEVPFDGPSVMAILWRASKEPPRRLESLVPTVPLDVADLVHSALQADRARRPATVRIFLDAALALPSLASAGGPSLTQRHQRSIAAPSSSEALSGEALSIAVAPTLDQPASPTPSPQSAPPSTPRPTPFGWSGEQALADARKKALSRVVRGLALGVVAAGLLAGGGAALLARRSTSDFRSVPAVSVAPTTTAVERVSVPATRLRVEVADAGPDGTAIASPVEPRIADPVSGVAARHPGRRRLDLSPTQPAQGSTPSSPSQRGYDPDRLLTP